VPTTSGPLRTFIVAIMQEFIFALQQALHVLVRSEDGLAAVRNVELAHKSLRERKAIKR